jgi:hypothetical protein
MGKRLQGIISLFLAIAMVICMAPGEAIAESLSVDFNAKIYEGEGENAPAETSIEDAEIEEEIASGRGEYQKEYQLSNGQRLMVMYPEAVHYMENGVWKEIDNTLKTEEKLTGSTYRNTAGLWEVRLPENINRSNEIEVKKNGASLKFRFAGELNTRPGEEVMGEASIESPEKSELVTVNGEAYGTAQVRLSVGVVQEQTNAYENAGGIQAATAQPKLNSAIE